MFFRSQQTIAMSSKGRKVQVLLLLLNLYYFGNCQIDPDTKTRIDETVTNVYLSGNNAPGLGMSIVKDGEGYYNTGYGYRDISSAVRADNDTLFFIGSNSKSFTAVLVIKVLHEHFPNLGELALDTPIAKLIPAANFTLSDRYRAESTTFRDILSHRTGTVPEGVGTFFGAFSEASELVYRQRYAPEVLPFRTGFLYDNGYFAMAGELAAAISGVPYLSMLDNLFAQLEMLDTTYIRADDDHDNMPNRALGYFHLNDQLEKYNSELYKRTVPMIAAGGILSNAKDMAKYLMFHLAKGKVGDTQIIPEEVMLWLHKVANPLPTSWKSGDGESYQSSIGYCLGLDLKVYDGFQNIGHGGYLTPFNSQMSLFPDLNIGIFTVTNGPGRLLPSISHYQLHLDVFDIMEGRSLSTKEKMTQSKADSNSKPEKIQGQILPTNQNNSIIGHYGNGQSGEFDVVLKENEGGISELYMQYGEWGMAWMRLVLGGDSEYALVWDSDIVQDFYTDGEVQITAVYDGENESIEFFQDGFPAGLWMKGQRLDDLPPIPWSPESCGPDSLFLSPNPLS